MSWLAATAALSLAAWLYLVLLHGRFWRGDQRLSGDGPEPRRWPSVTAVIPARDEAPLLPATLRSLLDQKYPGDFRIVLADDESSDGTGDVARALAREHGSGARLRVVATPARPPGWVGKMWALETGVRAAAADAPPEYWLLTDADIAHSPDNLRRLVAKAEIERLDLVSLMVRLHAGSGWGSLLVPAFVYFLQKLYPFPRVNDPRARTAAAAGGCVLVRSAALTRAGGIEALRSEVIDDCALGRNVKRGGPVWLGLSADTRSIRPYQGIGDVWNMVARSAYTQLSYSPWLLAGTLVGLALLYLVPPLCVLAFPIHGQALAATLAAGAWGLQALSFAPTLALYRRPRALALALPLAGALYAAMTFDSARRHARKQGALWKGRAGAGRSEPPYEH
jgi:hopene-associated glycosyltransferase HpnB